MPAKKFIYPVVLATDQTGWQLGRYWVDGADTALAAGTKAASLAPATKNSSNVTADLRCKNLLPPETNEIEIIVAAEDEAGADDLDIGDLKIWFYADNGPALDCCALTVMTCGKHQVIDNFATGYTKKAFSAAADSAFVDTMTLGSVRWSPTPILMNSGNDGIARLVVDPRGARYVFFEITGGELDGTHFVSVFWRTL